MAMQSFHDQNEDAVMGEINMTPLVDVMLVLLIVFIITVPVLQHAVPLSLPSANSAPEQLKPDHIQIAIDAQGQTFWNGQPVAAEALPERMRAESLKQPQPVVQLRADRNVRYDAVARTLAAAQQAGLTQIGFVTEPVR
ncbi:biopolymer transporter ExbD [Brachymonas denitrificans]|uniref:ExbD/TolR family protein n=1 Tax=Brachymonas denitrificans TaxID=28220 RepID=UPI002AFFBF07|nr:biopolymer transporter ExbD [Brachymonas denitrificans]